MKKESISMLLSQQNIIGLKISVESVAVSVKLMFYEGAKFILTSCFNQDRL